MYKLKLPAKWRIYNIFQISLLKQDTIRKEQMNKFLSVQDLELGNNKEYKVETIWDSIIYTKKVDKYLLRLYYLVV